MNEQTKAGPMLYGCDELREWLVTQGFRVAHDSLSRDNECNWYAYRRITQPTRECEGNAGKPMQLVVWPRKLTHAHGNWESVVVDVTGEAGGTWYKLQAYSLTHDELRERLGEIETSLIAAWNALYPVARSTNSYSEHEERDDGN